MSSLKLEKYFDDVFSERYREDGKPRAVVHHYTTAIRNFRAFLDRDPLLIDVTEANTNAFLVWLLENGKTADTAQKYRRYLRQIANDANPGQCETRYAKGMQLGKWWRDEIAKQGEHCGKQLKQSAKKFGSFLGKEPSQEDITADSLRDFAAWANSTLKQSTIGLMVSSLRACAHRHDPDRPLSFDKESVLAIQRRDEGETEGSLTWLAIRYQASRPFGCEEHYRSLYRAVRKFGSHLGRVAMMTDLNEENLQSYILNRAAEAAPVTVNGESRRLMILARFAWRKRLAEDVPREVPRVPVPRRLPKAWTMSEFESLLEAAFMMDGELNVSDGVPSEKRRIPCNLYWPAIALVAYDTGLRRTDLFRLTRQHFEQGYLLIHKSQIERPFSISDETRELVEQLYDPVRPTVFRIWSHLRSAHTKWGLLLQFAGIEPGRKTGFHMLRRTSATHLEAESPGAAKYHLGHLTPGLAERHYIDPLIARPKNTAAMLPRPKLSRGK